MGLRRWRRAVPLGLVLVVLPVNTGPGAAARVEGPCTASFNGVDASEIEGLGSPLEVQDGDILTFAGIDETGTGSVSIDVVLGPVALETGEATYDPRQREFSASIDLNDVTPQAVGLFRIRGRTDNCTAEAWMRVKGRNPFTTLIGLTAAGLTLGGLACQFVFIASRRRWSPWAAAIAGSATGVGAAAIAQEFGRLQISYLSLGAAAATAASLGAIFAVDLPGWGGAGFLARRREEATRRRAIRYQARLETARLDAERREAEADAERHPRLDVEAGDEAGRHDVSPELPSSAPAVAAARAPTTATAPEGPYWCYVMAPVDLLDLTDHTRVVDTLQPGIWYLAKRKIGGWVHVSVGDGREGWAPNNAVHKHG